MYKPQVELVRKDLRDSFLPDFLVSKIKVNTVDAFQGSELDFIIISTVRSNSKGNIGFLSDERRLNVAISRAKEGLAIFGNTQTLEKSGNKHWRALVQWYRENNLIRKI